MIDIRSYLPALEMTHRQLMTDTMDVIRYGVTVATGIPCRATSNRLFAEPADPQDANMRSMSEWGVTYPIGVDVNVGDRLVITTPVLTMDIIVGEVVEGDTWQIASRARGNRPKEATPQISVVLLRYDMLTDIWSEQPAQLVNVVYDRNQPKSTPVRFVPSGQTSYQGGWLIGDQDFDVRVDDRFTIDDLAGIIVEVLPLQPQRTEARFVLDVSGVR